jgi:aminoglycoside phosphotransferase (APT) family kinase protein
MNRVLVALHSVDIEAAGLSDYGKPGNYFERQYDPWSSQYRASQTRRIKPMEALIRWLRENLPADGNTSNRNAAQFESYVEPMAELALEAIDQS